jgi:predicted nucleic acid-binding Zn ribbon protein
MSCTLASNVEDFNSEAKCVPDVLKSAKKVKRFTLIWLPVIMLIMHGIVPGYALPHHNTQIKFEKKFVLNKLIDRYYWKMGASCRCSE